MGKVIGSVRLTSLFDPTEMEIEVVIDTGATMPVLLPQDVVKLGARRIRKFLRRCEYV